MPRIPVYQQRSTPNPTGTNPSFRADPVAQGLGRLGQGVDALGRSLAHQAERSRSEEERKRETADRIQAAVLAASFDSGMHKYLQDAQTQTAPGADKFTDNFYSEFDKSAGAYEEAAGSETVKNLVRAHVAGSREAFGRSAMSFEASERARNYGRQIDDGIEISAKTVLQNPQDYERQMGLWASTINATPVTPEARAALLDQARGKMANNAVMGLIDRDPEAFLVSEPNTSAWRSLTGDEQRKALNYADSAARSAVSARVSRYEMQRKEAERAEKDINEHFSKEGDKLMTAGKLTPKWVEANRNNMSASDYRYFNRSMRGDDGESQKTNPVIYSELRERAGRGEDVRGDAREALTNGRIKIADYDKLLNAVDSNSAIGVSWYKRGSSYIRDTLKPSDMNYDPAAAQRMASAMDGWTEWASRNPNASDDDARNAYTRLTQEYGMIDFQQMTITKRKPTFLIGGRNAPDIDATEEATVDALQSGQITQDEFDRQADLLRDWRSSLEAQQKFAKPEQKK